MVATEVVNVISVNVWMVIDISWEKKKEAHKRVGKEKRGETDA